MLIFLLGANRPGAKRLGGRNDQGAKRPGAKCRWGETSRGRTGSGAKRPGFVNATLPVSSSTMVNRNFSS